MAVLMASVLFVTGMAVEFTVFDAKYLSEREATLADRALVQCLRTTAAVATARNAKTIADTASTRERKHWKKFCKTEMLPSV